MDKPKSLPLIKAGILRPAVAWLEDRGANVQHCLDRAHVPLELIASGGWITRELTEAVAEYLDIPPVWAHEVVSFYSMFFTEPVGRHKVNICTNISCWLNGAEGMVAHAEEKLGVKLGGTTGDGRITLVREEECLAGCCGAPMAVIDGHYHENLDLQKLDAILDGLE